MDVEIDDRDPLDTVLLLGVARRDRRVVEQAEAHRRRGLGVMAGRARGDEGVVGRRSITSSTARIAPPAARIAASKLPGDIVVSASSRAMPSFGVASRIAST